MNFKMVSHEFSVCGSWLPGTVDIKQDCMVFVVKTGSSVTDDIFYLNAFWCMTFGA